MDWEEFDENSEDNEMDGVNSIDLLVEKLKSKGIDVHCAECDVLSFSIDGICFTMSAARSGASNG